MKFQKGRGDKTRAAESVETGPGIGRNRTFCLESQSELDSVSLCRLRRWPGVAGYHLSTDSDFLAGRLVIYLPENIDRREEGESGRVEMKLKRHLVI